MVRWGYSKAKFGERFDEMNGREGFPVPCVGACLVRASVADHGDWSLTVIR